MNWSDVLDVIGIDWSRRWVKVRTVVVVTALFAAPGAVVKGLHWYSVERSGQIMKMFAPLERAPSSPATPSPRP